MADRPYHFAAIVGGAIAGSVAAEIFADRGIQAVVIEENKRPYGKIEDGLPRWHLEQREQEYRRIDARLRKPGVFFLPCTKLGRDLDFQDLYNNWGFSVVVLANGAWRDRQLGIPGAEEFIGKGLVYQNPFINWYNHKNQEGYAGPRYQAPDEALVVGGGLASIDVVKVLQLENYERVLRSRGVQTDVYELEKKGVPHKAIFARHCYTARRSPPKSSKTTSASRTEDRRLRGSMRAPKPKELRKRTRFGSGFRLCRVCHTSKSQRSSGGFASFRNG